jgi:hypothetical protein
MNLQQTASIYIPYIQEWASITGACIENGKFRLIWKTNSNKSGTIDLDTTQDLVKSFTVVPF